MKSALLVGDFFVDRLGRWGVCLDLARQLPALGWSVITTSRRTNRLLRLLDMVATAWRRRQDYQVAQVDVYSGLAFVWAEAVCAVLRRAHKPYILTLRGGSLPAFAQQHPERVRRLLASAAAVTAPSGYQREQMNLALSPRVGATHGSPLPLITLIPSPLNLSVYSFSLRDMPAPRMVWLRSFHALYNPTLAVETLARLQSDFPNIQLTMIGPDKGDGSLQRTKTLAQRLGVVDRLNLTGGIAKSDVPQRLKESDIFLNTTNADNTPVSVIEAMVCGLCVVSTNVGGLPYLLENEYNALLVPPNDPDAMANAVRRILTEAGLAEKLSRNARTKAETFALDAVLPQWDTLLTAVAR